MHYYHLHLTDEEMVAETPLTCLGSHSQVSGSGDPNPGSWLLSRWISYTTHPDASHFFYFYK